MSVSGKTAFLKRLKKSVMSRMRPLSESQRLDEAQLVAQGIPANEARAIAQGYEAVAKADAPPISDAYLRAYHRAAKTQLPPWQHKLLHQAATGPAVSVGRNSARARRDKSKQAFVMEMDALKKRLQQMQAAIGKAGPLASQVHVPVPLGGNKKDKAIIVKRAGVQAPSAQELAYIQAAYGLQEPTLPHDTDEGTVSPALQPLLQANALVQGMDEEMAATDDVTVARQRASRLLKERPGHYRYSGVPHAVRHLHGLMLDVGSGQNRARGHLGLDVFAYDYGTVLHDVTLGLPFPEGSVRHINVAYTLQDMLTEPGTAFALESFLQECQRVLMVGGLLTYTDRAPIAPEGRDWALPGLVVLDTQKRPQGVTQTFERVPLRVPAFHGADALYQPALPMPLDMQLALAAYNTTPAQAAMANLVHKAEGRMVSIAKADDDKRIITGVVLNASAVDTQGDYMLPQDIEQAAYNYMKQSRVIGSEHGKPIDASVVESYIAPQDLVFEGPAGTEHVSQGSWLMSVHVPDDAEWAMVKSGEYSGFSVGGLGTRLPEAAAA